MEDKSSTGLAEAMMEESSLVQLTVGSRGDVAVGVFRLPLVTASAVSSLMGSSCEAGSFRGPSPAAVQLQLHQDKKQSDSQSARPYTAAQHFYSTAEVKRI